MTNSRSLRGMLAALCVSTCCLAALWLWAVPGVLSPSSFAFLTVVVTGGATVSLLTWRNAQAASTVGQLLQETEAADGGPVARAKTRVRSN